MTHEPVVSADPERLERLWSGEFGDAYLARNAAPITERAGFWNSIVEQFPARNVLEVGCAHGENLRHLARLLPARALWGVDVNQQALSTVVKIAPGVNIGWAPARQLPFRDCYFDLVFTIGLLIHQPDATLPVVMSEIVRCSRRWVLCGEYHADEATEVDYQGRSGVLFKRDYGRLYQDLFPDMELRAHGFLTREEGFDRVSYHLFERVL